MDNHSQAKWALDWQKKHPVEMAEFRKKGVKAIREWWNRNPPKELVEQWFAKSGSRLTEWVENHKEENWYSQRKKGPWSISGYKGVSRHRSRFHARICVHGVQQHLGSFDTPEEAAVAYNESALKHFGPNCYQNPV